MKFVAKVCANLACRSDKVRLDAVVEWDPTLQEWVYTGEGNSSSPFCTKCGAPAEDYPLKGKKLRRARAHSLAINHGWLPGDEDTATEYCDTFGSDGDLDYTKPIEDEESIT